MIRKIFILLFLFLLTGYMIIAVTVLNARPVQQTCDGMELLIKDSVNYGFITKQDILKSLIAKGLSPIGKDMDVINTREIEEELGNHPLIDNVECFRTLNKSIGIEITQRIPILRIMASNGDNYYVDKKGNIMPISNSSAHVPIVTGAVNHSLAVKELYEFGKFLQKNSLWQAQIQQIHVTPNMELELIPRVGDHIIYLGKPENYDSKFERLETFYKKALNQIGWNKYSRISLEFENQIICTKKEK